MLRKIKLTNFKCFESAALRCAPLTLLCGGNGAGKSSVIQALLVLRQSFSSGELQKGRLVLGGELVDLGADRDVLCESATEDVVAFELHADEAAEPYRLALDYSKSDDRLQVRPATAPPPRPSWRPHDGVAWVDLPLHGLPWLEVPPFGGSVIYVSAERIGLRKSYGYSEVSARRGDLGARSEYALNLLQARADEVLSAEDPRGSALPSRRLMEVVDHWLREVTPGAHLQLETIQDADAIVAGFSFDRPGDVRTRRYRATNVGFGLSYTLPVLTALMASPGTLCLIENPEAHLHPRGQTRLAELAARAALAGVQVMVETHSDHFMDGVRIAVRDGLIQPDQVTFHYFDREDGKTVVSSPRVDADGRISSWPAGFFDQHEENLARLLAPKA